MLIVHRLPNSLFLSQDTKEIITCETPLPLILGRRLCSTIASISDESVETSHQISVSRFLSAGESYKNSPKVINFHLKKNA